MKSVSNYEKRMRELHKNDDRPGKPTYQSDQRNAHSNDRPGRSTSTSTQAQTKAVLQKEFNRTKPTATMRTARSYETSDWLAGQAKDRYGATQAGRGSGNVGKATKKPTGTVSNAPSKGKWTVSDKKPTGTVRNAPKKAWNAEEEMRKRREAAMAKKKGK